MKGKLIRSIKVREDDGGIMEVKLWQVPSSGNRPHGYKYSLVYIVDDKRIIVGYDNAEGKGDHRHYHDKEEPYKFKDIDSLLRDFQNDVERYKENKP